MILLSIKQLANKKKKNTKQQQQKKQAGWKQHVWQGLEILFLLLFQPIQCR